jgi:hypothetical protein
VTLSWIWWLAVVIHVAAAKHLIGRVGKRRFLVVSNSYIYLNPINILSALHPVQSEAGLPPEQERAPGWKKY